VGPVLGMGGEATGVETKRRRRSHDCGQRGHRLPQAGLHATPHHYMDQVSALDECLLGLCLITTFKLNPNRLVRFDPRSFVSNLITYLCSSCRFLHDRMPWLLGHPIFFGRPFPWQWGDWRLPHAPVLSASMTGLGVTAARLSAGLPTVGSLLHEGLPGTQQPQTSAEGGKVRPYSSSYSIGRRKWPHSILSHARAPVAYFGMSSRGAWLGGGTGEGARRRSQAGLAGWAVGVEVSGWRSTLGHVTGQCR
jgi:hypothetical protein